MEKKHLAQAIDGRAIAKKIKAELGQKMRGLKKRPGLSAILVGDDPASRLYVELKERACEQVDINFHKYLCKKQCCDDISEKKILGLINFLNQDREIHGILLQLPLPAGYDTAKLIAAIGAEKDVDGFHYQKNKILSPVIGAINELIKAVPNLKYGEKKVLAIIKNDEFAANLTAHLSELGFKKIERAKSIPKNSNDYDIIIIALGQAQILKKGMVKNEAIIIDVGINKKTNRVVGDVDKRVWEVAGYVSPVPGGVGPLTIACLLKNTFELYNRQNRTNN